MGEPVSLVIVGVGGMGAVYLQALLERKDEGLFRIAGAVDPQPNRCKQYTEMRAEGVPCFVNLPDFYRNRKADLAVLSTPIQLHIPQISFALAKGSHVLCEKPAAGTIQEVRAGLAAERESGRWVAVGYQWSFSPAVQALKADIRAGPVRRGEAVQVPLPLAPRRGLLRQERLGRAPARRRGGLGPRQPGPERHGPRPPQHVLCLGPGEGDERSAGRGRGRALPGQRHRELRHGGRPGADRGGRRDPVPGEPRLERGPRTDRPLRVRERRREVREPDLGPVGGVPRREPQGLRRARRRTDEQALAVDRRRARGGRAPLCGLEAAASQTLCMNGIQDSMPEIRDFPAAMVRTVEGAEAGAGRLTVATPGAKRRIVEGLDEALAGCYEAGRLPSEMGLEWSAAGTAVDLRELRRVPVAIGRGEGERGERMRIRIDKIVYPGRRMGLLDGKVVFTDLGLPGETVEVEITRDRKSYAEARTVAVVEASPARVEPRCAHYVACSPYQDMDYGLELEVKKGQVAEIMARELRLSFERPGRHAVARACGATGTRSGSGSCGGGPGGAARFVYNEPGEQASYVTVDRCHLVPDRVNDLLARLRGIVDDGPFGSVEAVEVRTSRARGESLAVFDLSSGAKRRPWARRSAPVKREFGLGRGRRVGLRREEVAGRAPVRAGFRRGGRRRTDLPHRRPVLLPGQRRHPRARLRRHRGGGRAVGRRDGRRPLLRAGDVRHPAGEEGPGGLRRRVGRREHRTAEKEPGPQRHREFRGVRRDDRGMAGRGPGQDAGGRRPRSAAEGRRPGGRGRARRRPRAARALPVVQSDDPGARPEGARPGLRDQGPARLRLLPPHAAHRDAGRAHPPRSRPHLIKMGGRREADFRTRPARFYDKIGTWSHVPHLISAT
ncbi:MAG: Gfo/Idh/MocA family oxidoreductase [Candidatus Moduliflexus flocculans]|nr:Gfo/Idh/MocA family oxidoreductase [Candidatus Moduliflexus flocculans]